MAGQARLLCISEDVPASLHYAVAIKKSLARHGVARKGVDGRLRSPFLGTKMAEELGFEPREGRPSAVFKTAALNHSTILPLGW